MADERRGWALGAVAIAVTSATAGCHGCHDNKPYTPYHLGDAPSSSAAANAGPSSAGLAPDAGFDPIPSTAAPGDGKSWTLAGTDVKAPVGRAFALGVEFDEHATDDDTDASDKKSLIAWARTPDGLRGEIVFASSASADVRTVAALPGELAPSGCTAKTALTRFGPRAVAFDFRPVCPPASRDRATRWIAIIRLPDPGDDEAKDPRSRSAEGRRGLPELGLELRFAALADGVTLEPTFESIDKDGDGRRDVVVSLAMSGAPKPLPAASASAKLVFFDRPAGLSRDPSEPDASLKEGIAAIAADARRPKGAAKVGALAGALRRLYTSLCEEAGHATVTTSGGAVRCGQVKLESDLAFAEVEAAVNLGEPVATLAALARVDALGSAGPRKKDVDKLIAKLLPKVTPAEVKPLVAVPAASAVVGFGPLAFLANGELLVRTAQGIVKADAALAESPAEPRAWSASLAYPPADPAWKLVSVERRCNVPMLFAHVEVKREGAAADSEVALPIATPPRCAPGTLTAISLGQNGLGALVAIGADVVQMPLASTAAANAPDALLAEPLTEEQLGAARSPDGLSLAIPSPRGVLVATIEGNSRKGKAALFDNADLEQASFCVPSNGGKRLACVAQGKAIVATR